MSTRRIHGPHAGRLPGRSRALTVSIALAVVGLDQATKAWALVTLPVGHSIRVLGPVLSWTRVDNTGAAFGLLPGSWPLLALFALVLAGALVYFAGRSGSDRIAVALGLVLGGAVGNLIDRAVRHDVIDFINVHVWPVFNVADAAVTVGALALVFFAFTGVGEPSFRSRVATVPSRSRQAPEDGAGRPER